MQNKTRLHKVSYPSPAVVAVCGGDMTQYKAKVIDEPNEWVTGELIIEGDRYYIRQTVEPIDSKCGIGKFEVVPKTVEEVKQ